MFITKEDYIQGKTDSPEDHAAKLHGQPKDSGTACHVHESHSGVDGSMIWMP